MTFPSTSGSRFPNAMDEIAPEGTSSTLSAFYHDHITEAINVLPAVYGPMPGIVSSWSIVDGSSPP